MIVRPRADLSASTALNRPAWLGSDAAPWTGFVLVHGVLIWLALTSPGWPLGDVERVYRGWAEGVISGSVVPGITTGFVYPVFALVPIVAAFAFGPAFYALSWLGIVTALNAWAFALLVGRRHGRFLVAAWWWLGFLLLLGPIALARIDAVSTPLVIVSLLWLRSRPFWAAALLTAATWVKVWPAAVLAALFVVSKRRWNVLAVAAFLSALIVAIALILGSGLNVFSFVTAQTARGIQIESPVATIWMWQVAFGVPGSYIYYDQQILTFQVTGSGINVAISLMTPLLALVVALVLLLGAVALRRGAGFAPLFPLLTLSLVVVLLAFNKVGSPQFIGWLAAPVILGLVLAGTAWRTPAVLAGVIALLTQVVYPYLYDWLLVAHPLMVLVLTIRNLLEFVLLGFTVRALFQLALGRADAPSGLSRDTMA